MSSLVSGIAKVFTSVGSGLAATLGSAVRGVGATLFTGSAATGTSAAGGGLANLFNGGGILSNIFRGAGNVLSRGPLGALTTAAAAAPAAGVAAAAPAAGGGFFSQLMGGLTDAATATGAAPAAAATAPAGGGFARGLGSFLGSEGGAGLMKGIGGAFAEKYKADTLMERDEAERKFLRDREETITNSYEVDASAMPGGVSAPVSTATGRRQKKKQNRQVWKYDASSGQIVATA
jgi:hypothetical protein